MGLKNVLDQTIGTVLSSDNIAVLKLDFVERLDLDLLVLPYEIHSLLVLIVDEL